MRAIVTYIGGDGFAKSYRMGDYHWRQHGFSLSVSGQRDIQLLASTPGFQVTVVGPPDEPVRNDEPDQPAEPDLAAQDEEPGSGAAPMPSPPMPSPPEGLVPAETKPARPRVQRSKASDKPDGDKRSRAPRKPKGA